MARRRARWESFGAPRRSIRCMRAGKKRAVSRGPVALAIVTAALAAGTVLPAAARAQLDGIAPLVRAGDDRTALARLDALDRRARNAPDAEYLRGRLLERLGEHAGAAAAFASAEPRLPESVRADARARRATELARAGDCRGALPLLDAVIAAGAPASLALVRARRAECLAAEHDPRAVEALREVAREDARGVDTFAIRVSLAEALDSSGDRAGAVGELRSLLVERPEHPDAENVEAQLDALGAPFAPTAEERVARARRLIDARRHREAIAELDLAGRPRAREARAEWLHLRGSALFKTRHDYEEAATTLAASARLGGATAVADELDAARALARAGRDAGAIRAYRALVRRHPSHAAAAEAEYYAALLELRRGRRAGAAAMQRFVEGPRAALDAELARDARFELGLFAFERSRGADAARWFDAYARSGAGAMVRGRGLYWLGRARALARDTSGAADAYRGAIAVEPLHWYGLLARQRLAALGEDAGPPFGASPSGAAAGAAPAPLGEITPPEEVRFYAALGLRADAVEALRAREAEVRAAAPSGRGLEALVAVYRTLGEASRPYRLVTREQARDLSAAPTAATRWAWDAAYPRAFEDAVVPAASAQGIDPEYLWAIMRQESGYEPEAVSYADAIGLLQLLPATASAVASRAGLELRREMLFDPQWNARLAAIYGAGLRRSYGMPLALAAYNGGGHRVQAWREARAPVDLDLFVERIPIDQTRNYIRRVTSHYAHYLYLRDPSAGWPLTLPDRVE